MYIVIVEYSGEIFNEDGIKKLCYDSLYIE